MKENKLNPKEEEFLATIKDFFQTRPVKEHLLFVDYWMELVLGGKVRKKWTNPSNLYFSYGKLNNLLKNCHKILQNEEVPTVLELSSVANGDTLANEKRVLTFFPYHLKEKEQLCPFKVVRSLFDKQGINICKQHLKECLANALQENYVCSHANYLAPLYGYIKKLIEACWLIHERILTKNSFAPPYYPEPLLNYALTEPFLFIEEEVNDPFLRIEAFFNFTNLNGYRKELQEWYFMAITDELAVKNPNDLFFIYNQYLSLIQAGYLIATKNLSYIPKLSKNNDNTMGQWLLGVRDRQAKNGYLALSDEVPHVLTMAERAAPLTFIKETFNLANVAKLRFGLKEWLEASFSKCSSIHGLASEYTFAQYLILQKLTEAFYLIITENATPELSSVTDISHEI